MKEYVFTELRYFSKQTCEKIKDETGLLSNIPDDLRYYFDFEDPLDF